MGGCTSKPTTGSNYSGHHETHIPDNDNNNNNKQLNQTTPNHNNKPTNPETSPFYPFYTPSPGRNWFSKKSSPATNPSSNSTPRRFFRRTFPPPSPAKHIKSVLARRQATGAVGNTAEVGGLDKSFGFSKHFGSKYEIGEEVGRGHFGYTCKAIFKKGEFKGQHVAVKVIPKSKMTTAIAIEDNFLFTSKDENSPLKAIDFGLSDFVKPDERLNDIVGSAYYVAPEVLHRSYSTEADVWSIGVIAYILLCGSRPFWARSESGIFRAVLKANPSFDEAPWPTLSSEAKDFVKRLLNKDPRKRLTAAQALGHQWIRDNNGNEVKVPLDISTLRLMKGYMRSSALRKAALRALSKTLTVDELYYLKEQFSLLEPSKSGSISMENIKSALMKHATDAMKESRVHDFLASLSALQYRRMDFEEFCAAAINIYQLESLDRWERHARCAYELFEKDGNRAIMIEELASELGLSPSVPVHAVLHDWIRHTDGKLSFLGFVKLLHGVSSRALANKPQ
ncbi:CDPK-related kinase 5-like [Bidens hawaiensis]|uniref:CDPK-related kinase 5-like n=1 Tax=Bidens hawaiensis TaxID=980011 RepID=UPI0040491331